MRGARARTRAGPVPRPPSPFPAQRGAARPAAVRWLGSVTPAWLVQACCWPSQSCSCWWWASPSSSTRPSAARRSPLRTEAFAAYSARRCSCNAHASCAALTAPAADERLCAGHPHRASHLRRRAPQLRDRPVPARAHQHGAVCARARARPREPADLAPPARAVCVQVFLNPIGFMLMEWGRQSKSNEEALRHSGARARPPAASAQ